MATGNITPYYSFKDKLLAGVIDFDGHTFKVALFTSSYTPSVAADAVLADISANEISGTGYTTGGAALSNVTTTPSGATTTVDADDVQWSAASFTAKYAVIYDDTVSGDPLVAYFDLETGVAGGVTVTSGTLDIRWNASGILTLT
jgi:hypothetical protein